MTPIEGNVAKYDLTRLACLTALLVGLVSPSDAEASGRMFIAAPDNRPVSAQELAAMRRIAERGSPMEWAIFGGIFRDGHTREGRPVARDDQEAVRWFRRAAERGDSLGQLMLGAMCAAGRGVRKDEGEAYMWFVLAAASPIDFGAKSELTKLDSKLSARTIADARHKAAAWRLAHPGNGSP